MCRIARPTRSQNLTGGHIDLAFDNITLAWPQAKAGHGARARGHEPTALA